jgi:hypothetical protein
MQKKLGSTNTYVHLSKTVILSLVLLKNAFTETNGQLVFLVSSQEDMFSNL